MHQGLRWILVISLLVTFIVVTPSAAQAATFTVLITDDSGYGSLRNAIVFANSGDVIDFDEDVTGTITLESPLPAITVDLTINGPGANTLAISGNNLYRVFEISRDSEVRINGLTVTKGYPDVGSITDGGGIHNAGTLHFTSSTISGNRAEDGGGIDNGGTLHLTSSIVAGNAAFGIGALNADVAGVMSSSTNSLIGVDPKLAPLADNGGSTQTMLPLADSPAINNGGDTCPATDQRGVSRPTGLACDIGAVEVPLQVVTATPPTAAAPSPPASPVAETLAATTVPNSFP